MRRILGTPILPLMANDDAFWGKVQKRENGCWEWTGYTLDSNGYGYSYRPGVASRLVHRISYELAKGPIPKGLCVCHTCDNRICVNPEHLWLGTRADNNRDRDAKGRTNRPIGEKHPRAKLKAADAVVIRGLQYQVTQKELARRFGVSPSTINQVQRGVIWA
jgi:hypothetical protein